MANKEDNISPLRVGLNMFPPLSTKSVDGFNGFEVELWEKVALRLHVEYTYEAFEFTELLSSLERGAVDVALGGITRTSRREKRFDFSHLTFDSGLTILAPRASRARGFAGFFKLFSWRDYRDVWLALLTLFSFIHVAAHGFWLVERTAGTVHSAYIPGILEAFWWAAVTVGSVGYGDFVPHTWGGRGLAVGVILIGFTLFGLYVAEMSSAITATRSRYGISGVSDLVGKIVGTKHGTTSVRALERLGAKIVPVPDISDAYTLLKAGKIDAIVFDVPVLRYYVMTHPHSDFHLVGDVFDPQTYGFALQEKSPLREKINRALLEIHESGEYDALYDKWFAGSGSRVDD